MALRLLFADFDSVILILLALLFCISDMSFPKFLFLISLGLG